MHFWFTLSKVDQNKQTNFAKTGDALLIIIARYTSTKEEFLINTC